MTLIDLTAQALAFATVCAKTLFVALKIAVGVPLWAVGLALLGVFLVFFAVEKKIFGRAADPQMVASEG